MKKKYASLALVATLLASTASYGQNTKDLELLQQFKDSLNAKASEKSLSSLAAHYANTVKRKTAYDSLTAQIVALYPNGEVAFGKKIQDLYSKAKTGDLTLPELNQLKATYPNQTYDNPQSMAGAYYGAILGSAFPSFLEKDSAEAVKLIPQMDYNSLNSVAWNMAESNKHLSVAEQMSRLSLEKTKTAIADSAKIPQEKREDRKNALEQTYAANADTYAYILSKLGKKKEALKYQEEAIQKKNDDEDMNTRYITLLNENGQYKKALEVGTKLYSENHGNSTMFDQIGIAYKKVNPSQSWDTYATTLQSQQKAAVKANLAKSLINKPSPAFSLKDMNGNTVSLSDYKGKVVVLDFWATWCGPCKMSFPGMQLAINKYKDNPNVVFLFIDTWENTEAKERQDAVNKVMASKNYTFHVLLDSKINEKDYEVAKAYTPFGITGIPVKFFIGKDGNVKFMLTGYPGSDDKVLDEVTNPVDYLLAES
ncbi:MULTISPECIES: redoxin domain-containing protein [Chitinophagaceae]